MGGGDVNVPGPTSQEQEIQQMQLEQMRQSNAMQQQLLPYLFAEMGYEYGPDGTIRKLPEEAEAVDPLQKMYEERALAYMKGEGEISPTFTENVADWEANLEEDLSRRLGPDWETTTAGIQAKNEFKSNVAGLEEDIRFGRITSLDALAGGRATLTAGLKSQEIQQLQTMHNPLMGIGQYGGGLLGAYQQQRQMQYDANKTNAANANARLTGLMSMAGQIGGGATSMMSDIRLKKNIQKIGKVNGHNIYSFEFKSGGGEQIGVMAQEVLLTRPDAVAMMDNGYLAVDYSKLF